MGEGASEVIRRASCTSLACFLLTLPVLCAQRDDQAVDEAIAKIGTEHYVEAVRILRPLAEKSSARAEFNLGMLYQKGLGVAKDDTTALAWFRKAAAQGLALAQYDVGWMYGNGAGVRHDDAEALAWYRKAAAQGLADAEYSVGLALTNGVGVKADDKEAVEWLRKAAEQDHGEAQGMLAALYCDGLGTAKDLIEGYKWFALSAGQQVAGAKEAMAALETVLTPEQIETAKNAAAEWRKAHPSKTTIIDLGDPIKPGDLPQ